ncbi:MAG: hypothetical protein IPL16_11435 [Ignavibacteria bacterium]|nr:hypothetical protein [Ignavibacteria bacterium]
MLKLPQFIMLICLLFFTLKAIAFSQLYLQWNKTYSGTANNSDDRGNDLVIDNSGNVIIVRYINSGDWIGFYYLKIYILKEIPSGKEHSIQVVTTMKKQSLLLLMKIIIIT